MKFAIGLLCAALGYCTLGWAQAPSYPAIDPQRITIARDAYGVPHIFAPTDAEAAYGLAWAACEDAFNLVQEVLLSGKGMMGRLKGKEGAPIDFMVHGIGARDVIAEKRSELSPDVLVYLDGYCQGINAYAAKHPEEVLLKKAFPVTIDDVLSSYMLSLTALSFAHQDIQKIMEGKLDSTYNNAPLGSNAYAFAPVKTRDNLTYLCINPHFYIEGPFSFYEAHMQTEQGMNMLGATFQGAPGIFMGTNQHGGWGMTYDELDLVDVYHLTMHPTKKNYYQWDGQWLALEKRPVWLKVRLGKLVIPVKKTTYWSKYGPTFKSPGKEFYSVRYGANMTVKAPEQVYRMNYAKNLDAFYEALNIQALPRFNIVYASKEGEIFYIDNGMVPQRPLDYPWNKVVEGKGAASLWTQFVPLDSMPQVRNPECGYVFNTNNTPFNVTCATENPDSTNASRYPWYMGFTKEENNRSHRMTELLGEKLIFDFEEFKAFKFDKKLPKRSRFLDSTRTLFSLSAEKYPHIKEGILLIQTWDREAEGTSVGATFFKVTLEHLFEQKKYGYKEFFTGFSATEQEWVSSIEAAMTHLKTHFGTLEVPLAQYQVLVRGDVAVPLPGYPDVLSASYTKPYKNGMQKCEITDAYTLFATYDENGPIRVETLVPFGPATKPGHPHYTSQMERFSKQQPKPMMMNKDDILRTAEKVYHPQ